MEPFDITLYNDILQQLAAAQLVQEMAKMDRAALVHDACYQALCKIRAVLDDDTLDDPACFQQIEKIVTIFEDLGSDGGSRHNF